MRTVVGVNLYLWEQTVKAKQRGTRYVYCRFPVQFNMNQSHFYYTAENKEDMSLSRRLEQ